MSTLQVHITAGPQAGTRLQLNQSPVTFGRAPDNTLVLDVQVVSRQHGELQRQDDGSWVLVNLSQNGTRVGRKKVTKKPYPLSEGASVSIGDTEVFRVHLAGGADDPGALPAEADGPDAAQPAERAPGAGLKGRSKLWIGLGVWLAVCVGLMIFFATLKNNEPDTGPSRAIWVPGQAITDMQGPEAGEYEVRQLLDEDLPPQDPNQSQFDAHIAKARRAYDEGNRGLYPAYLHYQQAISLSQDRDNPLDPLDQRRYDNVLDDLAPIIYDQYMQAYRLCRKGSYARGIELLDDLRKNYYTTSDPDDDLANHIKNLRNAAHRQLGG